MAPVVTKAAEGKARTPRILVVDDEPTLIELVGDVVGGTIACKVVTARTLDEAKKILATTSIELLVADVNLPDGDGTKLLATLRQQQPNASAIVITGAPSVDGAINAMREGAVDFLPKPFTADNLIIRVNKALAHQAATVKREKRLDKLRDAVKRLNEARRLVSKKVDLLCNDLITAYGDLSKQLDVVRTQEGFRNLLGEAKDLEQMLCHAMDWLLRQLGYANVAIWLTGDDGAYQLGAYMKYTTAGEPAFTEAMRNGILRTINHEGFVHLCADEAREKLTPAELQFMPNQSVMGVTCTYLGESLGAIVLFRDAKTPFTDEDAAALKMISPIFATSLASIVHDEGDDGGGDGGDDGDGDRGEDGSDDGNGGALLDGGGDGDSGSKSKPPRKRREEKNDADWWKRGEAPPF
ncbi:MAG: response regulator [Tepidisphaeraceae bacterium]